MIKTELACQNCTYWRQFKGSFGQCEGQGEIYDGSRKGSACIGWRVNNSLHHNLPKKEQEIKEHCPSLRKIYNDLHKKSCKATHITNVDGDFVSFTSDIHTKNGYYRHRYNYTLIDVALTLFLQGKTYNEVVKHMNENYMKPMSRRTFREWVKKFLGDAWDERFSTPSRRCTRCGGGNMVKDGKKNGKQQWECRSCKRKTIKDYNTVDDNNISHEHTHCHF